MFRKLEDLNFVIVSACDELSRVDFEFRASNFRFRHLNTYDQFWRDFYKLLLGRETSDKRYGLSDERLPFFGQLWNQWPTSRGMGSRFGMEYAVKPFYTDIGFFYSV